MAIDKEFLDLLACPETKQPVAEAPQELVQKLNKAIAERRLKNVQGKAVEEKLDGGLIREDQVVLYPVREDIPIMLIEEGIPLAQVS
ncbi:MAG: hypothetical protein U1E76_27815 [Planctomycetota bacterium]